MVIRSDEKNEEFDETTKGLGFKSAKAKIQVKNRQEYKNIPETRDL